MPEGDCFTVRELLRAMQILPTFLEREDEDAFNTDLLLFFRIGLDTPLQPRWDLDA